MPSSINQAINFLETQWSSINENKTKGVLAEIRFINYLYSTQVKPLYFQIIPGGWIMTPGQTWTKCITPTAHRIAIIPNLTKFSWSPQLRTHSFTAQVIAHTYFGHAGIPVYFSDIDISINQYEAQFLIPSSKNYVTPYPLIFKTVGENGLEQVKLENMMANFKPRNGFAGMRSYSTGRLNPTILPWNDPSTVTELFWKEYVRYFIQVRYLVSNNDVDFFLVSNSRKAYPVELKSKSCVKNDKTIGDWFGLDAGTYVKLSFFISSGNNMDALYVVEEVNNTGQHLQWLGIRFSKLLNCCSWVTQGGGTGMTGGNSTTIKVPKTMFTELSQLLPTL